MSEGKKGTPGWVWIVVLVVAAPLVLVIIGIGASLALYGVRKYVMNAKQAEAQASLTAWGDGIVRCADRDGRLPVTSYPVPVNLSAVSGRKYQSTASDWTQPAHTCAGFNIAGPQIYQYSWSLQSPSQGLLDASADLDGDGNVDSQLQVAVVCAAERCTHGAPAIVSGGGHAALASATVALPGLPAGGPLPAFDGGMIDVSSVMGRARKLADQWEPDATLLSLEATVQSGKIQPEQGGSATVTFGPSRFASSATRTGLFVVTYDKSGIHGEPRAGKAAVGLPEPMCSPESALQRVAELGTVPLSLRYGPDSVDRPSWIIHPVGEPKQLRIFEPQACAPRGTIVVQPRP